MDGSSVIAATLPLPRAAPPVVGLGGFLKTTVTVIDGDRAHVSQPLGDLDTAPARAAHAQALARLLAETGVTPVAAAHDLHPDFPTTRLAPTVAPRAVAVQHHHAHLAAVAAENGHDGPLLGLALDGFGLGPGNQSWGGELLRVDGGAFTRLGHLRPLPQPGGDAAARRPWRMAAAALHDMGRGDEIPLRFADQPLVSALARLLNSGARVPQTTGAGRLFDAACGLLGLHPVVDFEGQAPMALEALVTAPRVLDGGWTVTPEGVLDTRPLLAALIDRDPADGADLFHGTLAAALADWAAGAARDAGLDAVGLSGGCFLNRVLETGVAQGLRARGLRVLTHRVVSPGDPGLSLGQAWAAARGLDP